MFDYLRCHYPLPVDGANARHYQTKDTPSQMVDDYEITTDGVLRSRERGSDGVIGEEWIAQSGVSGEINFYDYDDDGGCIEFSADFVNGLLMELRLVCDTTNGKVSAPTGG